MAADLQAGAHHENHVILMIEPTLFWFSTKAVMVCRHGRKAAGHSTGLLAMMCKASRAVGQASGLWPVLDINRQTVCQPLAEGISSPPLLTNIRTCTNDRMLQFVLASGS